MKANETSSPAPDVFQLDLPAVIPLFYAVPSFLLNFLIIAVVLTSFRTPFYRLYVITAVTDILAWTINYFIFRAANAPLFFGVFAQLPEAGPAIDLINFFAYYFLYVQYAMTFFTGLNRFTAISMPSRHMILWRKYFPYMIVVIVVSPLPFTYHILQYGGYLVLRNPQNVYEGYRLDVNEEQTGPRNALLMMIVLSLHGTALVLIHLYIAVSLCKRRRNKQRAEGAEDTRDTEVMLFLFTAFLLVFSIIFFVGQCLFFFVGYDLTEQQALTLIFIQTVVYDIHICSAPWALLAMSKAVRREVLKRIGLYNKAIDDRLFTTSGNSGQPT